VFFFGIFSAFSVNNSGDDGVFSSSKELEQSNSNAEREKNRLRDRADIVRFLAGDPVGFEDIMTRYRPQAYSIAISQVGNHDDAMDAVQKAFIRIHRSLHKFRIDEPFFPWFYRVVRNSAMNQRRDEKRHQGEMPLEWVHQDDGRPDPLAQTLADDLLSKIWQGIQELSPEMRNVFHLFHFEGKSYREIAEAENIPIGTVMSRLHGARLRLARVKGLEEVL